MLLVLGFLLLDKAREHSLCRWPRDRKLDRLPVGRGGTFEAIMEPGLQGGLSTDGNIGQGHQRHHCRDVEISDAEAFAEHVAVA